ncbi:MAG: methylated-DNA--[protein]-cysteine S-methyltransferase [Gammaproteobacteria bacterium]|nr:methylated-DNA--[protein]-cysteine S-methyltransferase [Gammaproteobacteria bacterium]
MKEFLVYQSPLGDMILAASAKGLCGVWFAGQKHLPVFSAWTKAERNPLLNETRRALTGYFASKDETFDFSLDLSAGTEFQQQVWRALQRIAPGRTTTYSDIARRIGKPSAVRAVAAAIGRNPLSIIVPCHRVIGRDGSLTGYAGGQQRKAALLALEAGYPPSAASKALSKGLPKRRDMVTT